MNRTRRSVTWPPPTTPRTIKRLLFTANEAKNCWPPPPAPRFSNNSFTSATLLTQPFRLESLVTSSIPLRSTIRHTRECEFALITMFSGFNWMLDMRLFSLSRIRWQGFLLKIDYYCEIVCDDSLGSNRTGIRTYIRILYRVVKRVFINYSLSSPH